MSKIIKQEFINLVKEEYNQNDQKKIFKAYDLMVSAHHDQPDRYDGIPYTDHPTYVAYKVQKVLIKPDADLIIAALLHDIVEDQNVKLIKNASSNEVTNRGEALKFLETQFGKTVSRIVAGLTNPILPDTLTPEEKLAIYTHHVQEAIQDPNVALVKLFDYVANSLHLNKVNNLERRNHFKNKYIPLKKMYLKRFSQLNNFPNVDPHKISPILDRISQLSYLE